MSEHILPPTLQIPKAVLLCHLTTLSKYDNCANNFRKVKTDLTSRLDRTEKELEGLENTLEQYRKHLIDYGLELKNYIFPSMKKKAKSKTRSLNSSFS